MSIVRAINELQANRWVYVENDPVYDDAVYQMEIFSGAAQKLIDGLNLINFSGPWDTVVEAEKAIGEGESMMFGNESLNEGIDDWLQLVLNAEDSLIWWEVIISADSPKLKDRIDGII